MPHRPSLADIDSHKAIRFDHVFDADLERNHNFLGLGLPTLAVQEGGYDTRVLGGNARHFVAGLQRVIYERRLERRGT